MKTFSKLVACAALLLVAGIAVRPAAAQVDCAAFTEKATCTNVDKTVDTGCCWTGDACSPKNDTHTASPDGGMCRSREVLNFGESKEDGVCLKTNLTLCNPGVMDAPAGCSVNTTTCYMNLGKPTWAVAYMGSDDGTESTVKPCVRGMNFEVDRIDNNAAFLYTDDKPMALLIPNGATLTVTAPEVAEGFRPGFRMTHAYITLPNGNFTVGWKATVAATGESSEGDMTYPNPPEGDVQDPEGFPIEPLHSFSIVNKGTTPDNIIHVVRMTFNRC